MSDPRSNPTILDHPSAHEASLGSRGTWANGMGRAAVLWVGLMLLAVWQVYHPERGRPFDILDFGEFLPILKRTSNYWEQTVALVRYYADQSGRANVVQMVALSLKWNLFREWVPGWQVSHAALMTTVTVLAYRFLRQAGATATGAIAGSAVLVLAPSAARSWVRLTVGEPFGMLLVLWTATRAFEFQRTAHWGREVILQSVMAVWVLLVKELMAPAIVLPVAIALTSRADGLFAWPTRTRRNIALVSAVASCSLLTLLPLAALYLAASDSALASQYGASSPSVGGTIARWIATLVPFTVAPPSVSLMWGAAAVAFLLLVAVGWWIGFHEPETQRRVPWLLVIALAFPLLGALAYAPWPAYQERYAYPYLIGTALLIGMAVTALERAGGMTRLGARGGLLVMMLFSASGAWAIAGRADAVQRVADEVVAHVSARSDVDSVFVATSLIYVPDWTGPGPTLHRFGTATGRPWPPTRDLLCEDAPDHLRSSDRKLLISFSPPCGSALGRESRIVSRYAVVDWTRWRVLQDSVTAGVLVAADLAVTKRAVP